MNQLKLNDTNDFKIWEFAKQNDYAIITFNSDFYDISLIKGFPTKINWLRLGNLPTNELAQIIIKNKQVVFEFLTHKDFEEIACL